MKSHNLFALLLTVTIVAPAPTEETESPVNRRVADFALKDFRGRQHQLSDFAETPIVVIAMLGTECPLAKLYGPRLAELAGKYKSRDVQFLGINANVQDSVTEIAAYARIHKLSFPLLKDVGNRVADKIGAVRTPEVFVLDKDRVIRYWGRIDDQYGVGYIRDEPKRNDLAVALDELLAGKKVRVPQTESVGCHIGRVQKPDARSEITYCNQIARILQRRCVQCHRDGDIAPFALTDYEEVAGWAEMIFEVVEQQRMPPWHASSEHGSFANDRRLSREEKETIYKWVRAGAPKGDPAQLPKPATFVQGWQLPQKPDRVIEMDDTPYEVPAEGTVRYKYFRVDPEFTEDRWVQMAEILPGNRAVVHHILVFVRPPTGKDRGIAGEFLAGYVPGLRARPLPDGMAKLIPAGSQLVFQMHYTPIGSPQEDISKIGLVFADAKDVTHRVVTTKAAARRLAIPPNAENHRVEAKSGAYWDDVQLLSMMPHAHLRGKAFRYVALYPDGKEEILLDVPQYDFNWQTSYRLKKPKSLPAGTRMHVIAHYDNSENNLANPDPSVTVRWGDQTWHEMMIGYFDIAVPHDPNQSDKGTSAAKKLIQLGIARKLIERHDKDGDGGVDRSEMPASHKAKFDGLDSNSDGRITVEELAKELHRLR